MALTGVAFLIVVAYEHHFVLVGESIWKEILEDLSSCRAKKLALYFVISL
jgi:hypothetical protein